jgi:hypothetical protein
LLGRYGGKAVAEALFGETNRWGKTPVTIYSEAVLDEFDMLSFSMTAGVGRSYRYYTGKNVLYPMGHGLSYTTFTFAAAAASAAAATAAAGDTSTTLAVGESLEVNIQVKNTGASSGDEVVMALFIPGEGTIPATAPAVGDQFHSANGPNTIFFVAKNVKLCLFRSTWHGSDLKLRTSRHTTKCRPVSSSKCLHLSE